LHQSVACFARYSLIRTWRWAAREQQLNDINAFGHQLPAAAAAAFSAFSRSLFTVWISQDIGVHAKS